MQIVHEFVRELLLVYNPQNWLAHVGDHDPAVSGREECLAVVAHSQSPNLAVGELGAVTDKVGLEAAQLKDRCSEIIFRDDTSTIYV
jgi:hypothetical protein